MNNYWNKNRELLEAHEKSLNKMEELKRFQGSTFDTISRRKLFEDRNTILELTGKIQELQNEINCMNDSRDFQDAESIRSGNSHVTSQPVLFPPVLDPGGMLSRSLGIAEPQQWTAKFFLGHTWFLVKRFCKSNGVFFSTLSARVESLGSDVSEHTSPHVTSESQTPVQDQRCQSRPSARNSVIRRIFKEIWGRPTTTADFRSSFRQIPNTSHVCLLEDKIQD